MKLTFCGGAQSVTGANYLLEGKNTKILIDCGMNQGGSFCEKRNFDPFPYDPKTIDALLVTHAHIDHTGRIPKLYKDGFRGKIFSTLPTKDCAEPMLYDAEHILNEERGSSRDRLYTPQDIAGAFSLWHGVSYHKPFSIGEFHITFYDAGHILGSSFIFITDGEKKIIFSGDLGNSPAPFIKELERIQEADYVLIESAYGGRLHESTSERKNMLEDAIEEVSASKGALLIPSFAMERTQEMIFDLNELVENKRIPRMPVFIDSPLAIQLTEIFKKYSHDPDFFSQDSIALQRSGDFVFEFPGLKMTRTTEESKLINEVPSPKVIVAGSGMSHGGRILHHEVRYLPDSRSMILFVGYQSKGSLGNKIQSGNETVRIFGEDVPVRCRQKSISGYSAHADQRQLLEWLEPARHVLKKVFIVQGEVDESGALAGKIRDELAVHAEVPTHGETVIL